MDEETRESISTSWLKKRKREQSELTGEEKAREKECAEVRAEYFARKSWKARERAERRTMLLMEAMELVDGGMQILSSFSIIGKKHGVNPANLRNWYYGTDRRPGVRRLDRTQWLYALTDRYTGRLRKAEFSTQAKEYFLALYLHGNAPDLSECYRRTHEAAQKQGWFVPSERSVRRMVAQYPRHQIDYLRGKDKDMRNVMPPQRRDHSYFEAGDAVNGDGLHLDICTLYEFGEVIERPVLWAWQDIRSSKILAYRLGKSECTEIVRLSLFDLLGLVTPKHVWTDNTPAASNKLVTGNDSNRHRFSNREDDPPGLLQLSGIKHHFTLPDHSLSSPGSKPIERAFGKGGLHQMIRKNPRLRGMGTLKTPVPAALLQEIIKEEVERFNAREGRRGMGMNDRSFNQVFAESYMKQHVVGISDFTRSLYLLEREVVKVGKDGLVVLNAGRGEGKNRYWSPVSSNYSGQQVVIYYDPENLTKSVRLFSLGGFFAGFVDYQPSVAFISKEEGRRYAKARKGRIKAEKKAAEALVTMRDLELQQLSNRVDPALMPEPAAKRKSFGDAEINRAMRGTLSSGERDRLRENMDRRVAAAG